VPEKKRNGGTRNQASGIHTAAMTVGTQNTRAANRQLTASFGLREGLVQ
jgi:hypothetical protein